MNTISQDDDLVKMIKLLLKGKEAHPRYQKWFDDFMTLEQRHLKNFVPLLNEFTPLKDKLIFDFGCGTGGSSVALGLSAAKVIGVEPDQMNIDVAAARIKKHHLDDLIKVSYLADTSKLPFPSETFDICICHSVLEYIPTDRHLYIREMWRILKPNGILFIGGSSNGIYPIEMHTGKWFINYIPSKTTSPRGISYWEIVNAIKPQKYVVLNQSLPRDGLTRYAQRLQDKEMSSLKKLQANIVVFFLRLIKATLCPMLGVPIEAFLPWLDIGLKKS